MPVRVAPAFESIRATRMTKARTITISSYDGAQLRSLAAQPEHVGRVALRARIVLSLADGEPVSQVARKLRVSEPTVRLWRERFMSLGIVGLVDAPRDGRPRQADSSTRSTIIRLLSQNPPHRHGWSLRDLSKATGLPLTTVHRICHEEGIPWPRQNLSALIYPERTGPAASGRNLAHRWIAHVRRWSDGHQGRRIPTVLRRRADASIHPRRLRQGGVP